MLWHIAVGGGAVARLLRVTAVAASFPRGLGFGARGRRLGWCIWLWPERHYPSGTSQTRFRGLSPRLGEDAPTTQRNPMLSFRSPG